jgi:hypothetical protein
MNKQPATVVKAIQTRDLIQAPRAPYQKPVLERLQGWKMLTGAPISVPVTDGIINFDLIHPGFEGR